MPVYHPLSKEVEEQIRTDRAEHRKNPYAFSDDAVIRRRQNPHDNTSLWRPSFVRDCEKIMNIPFYNRYADKTQVFSLYKNDDITRRLYHVQLVARIARNIGRALDLNLDLIEAISLGHDIGHTPFGHAGERILSDIYYRNTNRYFNHNIHSARVLDRIFPVNISLQTLDGVICHNGELELKEYRPIAYHDFATFDQRMEMCYLDKNKIDGLIPSTLEGCVMRVCDIIAYLGKDRQDAMKLNRINDTRAFADRGIGVSNAEIIHNLSVNIIEHSYGKPYLAMDEEYYSALSQGKRDNGYLIYKNDGNSKVFEQQITPMFEAVYERLKSDYLQKNRDSVIYKHHIDYIKDYTRFYKNVTSYEEETADDVVVDFIASMTDDYFIDLYNYLFPGGKYHVEYKGYFDEMN